MASSLHRERTADQKGEARWDPASCSAVVRRVKGKFMSTMGYASTLFPEEAVFLADRDEIDLVVEVEGQDDDKLLKGADVFAVLEQAGIDIRAYTAYAAMREQRFPVFRAGAWKCQNKTEFAQLPAPKSGPVLSGNSESALVLSYDVYMPSANFSKGNMGKPDFSVAVLSADDILPSVASLRATVESAEPGVPSRMCIVGDSSVTFVELSLFDPSADPRKETDFKKLRRSAPDTATVAAPSSTTTTTITTSTTTPRPPPGDPAQPEETGAGEDS